MCRENLPLFVVLSCVLAATAADPQRPAPAEPATSLAGPATQPAVQPADSQPAHDERAVQVLREACEFIRRQKEFTTTCLLKRVEGGEQEGRVLELRGRLAFRRPRELKVVSDRPRWRTGGKPLEGDNGLSVSDIFCDGRKIDFVMPTLEKYVRQEPPENVSHVFENGTYPERTNFAGITVFPVFLTDDPLQVMMHGPWTLEYVGREKLHGIECHVLRQKTAGVVDWRIWIGADQPLFHQFATDLSRAEAEKMQVVVAAFEIRFTDWNLSPNLPDADFAYTPPAAFKSVESFAAPASGPAPAAESQPAAKP